MIDCSQGSSSNTKCNGHRKIRQKRTKLCVLVVAEMAMSASSDLLIQSCNIHKVFDKVSHCKLTDSSYVVFLR